MTNIHFIAIGGAAMHNLALALAKKGFVVSGSDDKIAEPSHSRLKKAGLLPKAEGWFPEKINTQIDAIILGMHARKDNPELLKALDLGLHIYSYPEFLYEQTKNKTRIALAGSHGKTTVTSMVMHVLKNSSMQFDYMVGAEIEGFDTMVSLNEESAIAVFEADEYLSSPLDPRPKFMHYKPHIALINGIAWDHINVFPTYEIYKQQFSNLIDIIEANGTLLYNETDDEVCQVVKNMDRDDLKVIPYGVHPYDLRDGLVTLITENNKHIPVHIFGEHNMINLSAAKNICLNLEISPDEFYASIASFKGSAKRLQQIFEDDTKKIFIDFAHAPSKLEATIDAICRTYPNYKVTAIFEMHSFSSLNKEFLKGYRGTMQMAAQAIVYCNPDVIKHKKLSPISNHEIEMAFDTQGLKVANNIDDLSKELSKAKLIDKQIFVFMSSGTFDGKTNGDLINMCQHDK